MVLFCTIPAAFFHLRGMSYEVNSENVTPCWMYFWRNIGYSYGAFP